MTKFTDWDAKPRVDLINKAVFLDRDGIITKTRIINGKPYPPQRVSETELVDGIIDVCKKLKRLGYLLIIVTNQPDVSRGIVTQHQVEEIHDWLKLMLPIDAIYTCCHDDDDNCNCRKPKPGMLLKARNIFKLDLSQCFLIGDTWKDIAAGARAECKTILVDYHYSNVVACATDATVNSVTEALEWIVSQLSN
jgi:D-glycero-D-manno-heptose 1,7-bisphosphate phosphatase